MCIDSIDMQKQENWPMIWSFTFFKKTGIDMGNHDKMWGLIYFIIM